MNTKYFTKINFQAMLLMLVVLCFGSTVSHAAEALPITTIRVVDTNKLDRPLAVTYAPGNPGRLFVVQQRGKVVMVDQNSGDVSPTPFLVESDILSGNEQGLLGIAFHPNFSTNGFVYINCVKGGGGAAGHTEIVRYTAKPPFTHATAVDPASRVVVLRYDQPQVNHNGGWLGFSPTDKCLYISVGDGGGSGDDDEFHGTTGNGQNLGVLLAKMLRIDVSTQPYSIPDGNMTGPGVRGEIFAFGLRNPWRCSFDRANGNLWIADVGQNRIEEVDFNPAGISGRNYGWRRFEASLLNDASVPLAKNIPHTPPVVQYSHDIGSSITGGYVYRGRAIPALQGTYFYADYARNRYFSFKPDANGVANSQQECTAQLNDGGLSGGTSSFGEDADGELYICDHKNGRLYKIVSALSIANSANLSPSTVGAKVEIRLTANAGSAPYTWTLVDGALPSGIKLIDGFLSGSPASPGSFTFTIKVTDSDNASATKSMSMQVNPGMVITGNSTLHNGAIGESYVEALAASGGTGMKVWQLDRGVLPNGLKLLSSGQISGTPTAAGVFNFTVRVTDAANAYSVKDLRLEITGGLSILTVALPQATVGAAYSQALTAVGGSKPFLWSVENGALPAGLALGASTGIISGTPTAPGTAAITIKITDNLKLTASRLLRITINPSLLISTDSLPTGNIGAPYQAILTRSGGTAPFVWSLIAGSLPTGLGLSGNQMSGTPTQAGTFSVGIQVADAAGMKSVKSLSLKISPSPIIISTPRTDGNLGTVYRYDVRAGGAPPPVYSLVISPSGMTINPTTGEIDWSPSRVGNFPVTVSASNGNLPNGQQSFVIKVTDYGLAQRPIAEAFLNMPRNTPIPPAAFPTLLSETGILQNAAGLILNSGFIHYDVNTTFWSDGAVKRRWVSIPNDGIEPVTAAEKVRFSEKAEWDFPAGTVFVKHFEFVTDETAPAKKRRLETRILVCTASAAYGVTYRWNADQTDAVAVTSGTTEDLVITTAGGGKRTQTWYYPSPSDCMQCHNQNANYVLGLNTRQLNRQILYPRTGQLDNQLRTWAHVGFFANLTLDDPVNSAGKIGRFAALSATNDQTASYTQRALSYLDSNCSYCHRPGGAPANFDARFTTPLAASGMLNGLVNSDLGIAGAKLIVPGSTDLSIIYQRIHTTEEFKMPPLGRNVIDVVGSNVIAQWIMDLPVAPPAAAAQ